MTQYKWHQDGRTAIYRCSDDDDNEVACICGRTSDDKYWVIIKNYDGKAHAELISGYNEAVTRTEDLLLIAKQLRNQ